MTLKLKSRIFKTWLVASFLWIVVFLIRGNSMDNAVSAPLLIGAVVWAIVWVVDHYPSGPIEVAKLRQLMANTLGVERAEDSEYYGTTLQAAVDRLEADFGRKIPVRHIQGLQHILSARVSEAQIQRQKIIDKAAKEGKVIELESRESVLSGISPDTGPQEREALVAQIDAFLGALKEKFGTSIPIEHAFRIQQDLEAGRDLRLDG